LSEALGGAERLRAAHAGAHHPALQHHFPDLDTQKEAATLGMWVFLAQEILFFGGLFCAYTVYRNLYYAGFSEASHHLDWKLGGVNTAVLIGSSLTMALAVRAAAQGRRGLIVLFLILTILLGGVFLGIKVFEYKEKFDHHLVPGHGFRWEGPNAHPAEIFYSLYFAMTGLHALHMIVGIPILAWIAWMAQRGRYSPAYHSPVEMVGLYWHFVDIVWIFLFPLLYLVGGKH
jgi:cytochrome c oxidase subunit 3